MNKIIIESDKKGRPKSYSISTEIKKEKSLEEMQVT